MKRFFLFSAIVALSVVLVQAQGLNPGDKAPDFKLKNVDGTMVSMADHADAKGFVVIFTCNHCPVSVAYEDRIIALHDKYAPKGYPVIAINPNDPAVQPQDSYEAMQKRAIDKGFPFPYLFDDGQKVYPKYGATRTPHVYIVQKEQSDYIVRYIGAIDNNQRDANNANERYVAAALDALLAGQPVPTATTVAIGCTIKVKK
jgi:peroxiredoxin